MWDLCGPGIEPMSPTLQGEFLTTGPLGEPSFWVFIWCEVGVRQFILHVDIQLSLYHLLRRLTLSLLNYVGLFVKNQLIIYVCSLSGLHSISLSMCLSFYQCHTVRIIVASLWVFKNFCLFLAVLDLCCCVSAFSGCRKQGLTLQCGARASWCRGFSCCDAWALGRGLQ